MQQRSEPLEAVASVHQQYHTWDCCSSPGVLTRTTGQPWKSARKKMKKALGETQTLRAGCSKAEPKMFTPPQTPLQEVRDGHNLISWRWSLPLPTDPVWWGSMHAILSYRGNRTQTHKRTHKQTNTQTGPITIHCAVQLSAQCNNHHHNHNHHTKTNHWWVTLIIIII